MVVTPLSEALIESTKVDKLSRTILHSIHLMCFSLFEIKRCFEGLNKLNLFY